LELDARELGRDPVEGLARLGATLILSRYIEAEVSAHLGAERYERTEERSGSRNGHRRRKVSCSVGALDIDFPKVRDAESPFRSQVLTRWQRSSATVMATLPQLYTEGLSTRDFERALSPMWEGTSLSRSTVSRANEEIKQAFQKWRTRSLALDEIAYLFLDGHYQGVRLGTKGKEAVLVAHAVTKGGSRMLLGLYLGCRESTDSWRLALEDLVSRKLSPPMLVISDGNPGLIRAVKEIWPQVPRQRCIVHRVRNVLARVPKKDHKRVSRSMNEVFYAPCLEEALTAARRFVGRWGNVYPEATMVLGKDLSDCLTFLRFPARHWRRLRTSNILERCFCEVKRRTRVVGRFPTEMSALSLIWAVMDEDSKTWRGMIMDDAHSSQASAAVESLRKEPIVVKGFEELLAA
jgi:transposase-like protein